MTKLIYLLLLALPSIPIICQEDNDQKNLRFLPMNDSDRKLNIGGYAQVDLTHQLQSGQRSNTSLDVSRMVMNLGYRFSDKTAFVAEVEFEHVKELYVEQAYLSHSFSDALGFRAGLMLIPMGIINEYHEPTTFNGVLRPMVESIIVPTTWREIGAGFAGRFQEAGLKYQLYLVNGFNSYGADGKGTLSGSAYLRSGRQRGAKSFLSAPNLSAKIEYFGIKGLKIGLAGYFGDTQSALFNHLDKSDNTLIARADSSVVGISMFGLDTRFSWKGFQGRAQIIYARQSNSGAYNSFTHSDLGSSVLGFYYEESYNLLKRTASSHQLIIFSRFEHYNTHLTVDPGLSRQDKYRVNEYIFGLGWKPAEGAVFKLDARLRKAKSENQYTPYLNAGIGVWF